MNGALTITALKKQLGVTTDHQLATKIGMSVGAIQLWKNREEVPPYRSLS